MVTTLELPFATGFDKDAEETLIPVNNVCGSACRRGRCRVATTSYANAPAAPLALRLFTCAQGAS